MNWSVETSGGGCTRIFHSIPTPFRRAWALNIPDVPRRSRRHRFQRPLKSCVITSCQLSFDLTVVTWWRPGAAICFVLVAKINNTFLFFSKIPKRPNHTTGVHCTDTDTDPLTVVQSKRKTNDGQCFDSICCAITWHEMSSAASLSRNLSLFTQFFVS